MNGYSEIPRLSSGKAIFVCHCEAKPKQSWLGLAETGYFYLSLRGAAGDVAISVALNSNS